MSRTEDSNYVITYNPTYGREDDEVRARYHTYSDLGDFVEFKDSDHSVVLAVKSRDILSIRRMSDAVSDAVNMLRAHQL